MDRKHRMSGHSTGPRSGDPGDLVERRKRLLESFFENGRQLAGELVQEIEAARRRLQDLESDNARLRMQLKSDAAIRELITKIEGLEAEREALLSRSAEVERQAQTEVARAAAAEDELSNLASLYVAVTQLHASLDPHEVIQTMGQLLLQFLGAGAYVIYTVEGDQLVPIASEGIATEALRAERVGAGVVGASLLSRDVVSTPENRSAGLPIATVPLRVGDQAIGAVAVFELLEQKRELLDADFELLRMLATQGATALAGARLYSAAGGIGGSAGRG
jgi:hypothetical protein